MSILGNMLGSSAYYKQARGDYETAKKMYASAIQKGLNDAEKYGAYGVILMREGNFDQALEIFNKGIALKPKPVIRLKLRINRAIVYTKTGEYEKALAALEDLHVQFRSLRVYETLGYLYVQMKSEKAEEYNLEAYEYDPDNYVILDNLCQLYINKGDYKKAREFANKAYEIEENKADILYHLALIEAHDKNTDKAKEYAERLMKASVTAMNEVTDESRKALYKSIVGKEYISE